MTVYDLNRDQLIELKQRYLMDTSADGNVSYDEMADADELVSDEEIFKASRHLEFVPDDFFCSAGEDEPEIYSLDLGYVSGERSYIADTLRAIANSIDAGNYGGIEYDTSWGLDKE